MKTLDERELMRYLHGELSAERRLEVRRALERDPELAARYRQIEAAWEGLELPPPTAVPPGFAGRVVAHAHAERPASELSWSLAPLWARAGAALALAAGVWLGSGLGQFLPTSASQTASSQTASSQTVTQEENWESYDTYEAAFDGPASLAEGYWLSLEQEGDELFEAGEALR